MQINLIDIYKNDKLIAESVNLSEGDRICGFKHARISRRIKGKDKVEIEGYLITRISDKKNNTIMESNLGVSIEKFREQNDTEYILSNGVKKLTKERLFSTKDFVNFIGLPTSNGYRQIEEMSQFDQYHGRCSKGVYWSHPEIIKEFKQKAILK